MTYQSFEQLDVWKRACRLAVDVCKVMGEAKPFALRDQMQRAAISIPSNVAEGSERDSSGDFIRFLRIAKGSSAELRTQCYLAGELGVLDKSRSRSFVEECREISAMLQGLIRSLDASKQSTGPGPGHE